MLAKGRQRKLAAALSLLLVIAIIFGVDPIRWRSVVVYQKATGEFGDLRWDELFTMIKPGSGFYLRDLVDTPNTFAVIRNPFKSSADIEVGARLYRSRCTQCHGAGGSTISGVDLLSGKPLEHGDSDWAIYRSVRDGIQDTAMAPVSLTDAERWQIVGYVNHQRTLTRLSRPQPSIDVQGLEVAAERLVNSRSEPQNWLTYSGTYDGWRHSTLDGIDRNSVDRLSLAWVMQTQSADRIEASPIVVDGTMFLTLPEGIVVALDATNGEEYWRWQAEIENRLSVCCGRVNRGAAILDGRVFAATLDNRLQALDAVTGKLVWETQIADPRDSYTVTVAPLAIGDRVLVGISGGEYGIRGFLDAYDASTGARAWRFWTIPGEGEPGNETWAGDSWKTGGGPTWVTGGYDPELDLVYWGVGNPAPDFDGRTRRGDNLYSNSVVALDANTGTLRWHFQFTPHDLHDFDSNQVPVLIDRELGGVPRKLMLWANRNGFFYVLDRVTGEYLGSTAFAKQTWAQSIDASGRPTKAPGSTPTPKGTIVWPGSSGATNWPPPTYNPESGLFYVLRLDRPSIFFNQETPEEREPGQLWLGSARTHVAREPETAVVAIDPTTQEIVWQTRLPNHGGSGRFSGLASTAELVYAGEGQGLYILDAKSGALLWSTRFGAVVGSPPILYAVDDTQYLTIAAGQSVFAFKAPLSNR